MSTHRIAAAAVALAAWAGLGIQFAATLNITGSVGETLIVLLRYFTVITNLLVAIVMTGIAVGQRVSPMLVGGVTIAILLVGTVYMLLLRGLVELSGGAILADTVLHKIVPVAVVGYWLAFTPKGGLRWRDPLTWMLYPVAYLAYAIVRGTFEGRYAYPFIDVATLGPAMAAANSLVIACGFIVAGMAMVALDRALGRHSRWRLEVRQTTG